MFALPKTFAVKLQAVDGTDLFSEEINDYHPLHALEFALAQYERNLHDPSLIVIITIHVEP